VTQPRQRAPSGRHVERHAVLWPGLPQS